MCGWKIRFSYFLSLFVSLQCLVLNFFYPSNFSLISVVIPLPVSKKIVSSSGQGLVDMQKNDQGQCLFTGILLKTGSSMVLHSPRQLINMAYRVHGCFLRDTGGSPTWNGQPYSASAGTCSQS